MAAVCSIPGEFVYRHNVLNKLSKGEALARFLRDIVRVYPGNGGRPIVDKKALLEEAPLAYVPGKEHWFVVEKGATKETCPAKRKRKRAKVSTDQPDREIFTEGSIVWDLDASPDCLNLSPSEESRQPAKFANVRSMNGVDDAESSGSSRRKQKLVSRNLVDTFHGNHSVAPTTPELKSAVNEDAAEFSNASPVASVEKGTHGNVDINITSNGRRGRKQAIIARPELH